MSNSSATGGYISQEEQLLPNGLTLLQTIQQMIVGLTNIDGTLVRPKWQTNPPTEPSASLTNWCSFGISITTEDLNPDVYPTTDGESSIMRIYEELNVDLSFFGPEGYKNVRNLRDGLKISQNRDALRAAGLGFKETTQIVNVPELHGQTWFQRNDMTLVLRREVLKTFAVLSLSGAGGTIEGQKSNDENENVLWNVSET